MSYSPILVVHICAGSLGLLSGTAAICFRKGSPRHVLAGKIFVASMLTMAVGAVYLAVTRHQPNNIGGGILTFYLIGTAWLTARRRDGETSRFDWFVLLIPLTLGVLLFHGALEPPAETALDGGDRAASIPGFIKHQPVFNSHHTSADFAYFLASPNPL